jgi:hypothetical protein
VRGPPISNPLSFWGSLRIGDLPEGARNRPQPNVDQTDALWGVTLSPLKGTPTNARANRIRDEIYLALRKAQCIGHKVGAPRLDPKESGMP